MDTRIDRHTFILRLWADDGSPAADLQLIARGWRGEVLHVLSDTKRYVRGWGEVEDFVHDTVLGPRSTDP